MNGSKIKKIKAWAVVDRKNELRIWTEGRIAIYSSTHGKDISFMRKKNTPDNFKVIPVLISPLAKTKKSK